LNAASARLGAVEALCCWKVCVQIRHLILAGCCSLKRALRCNANKTHKVRLQEWIAPYMVMLWSCRGPSLPLAMNAAGCCCRPSSFSGEAVRRRGSFVMLPAEHEHLHPCTLILAAIHVAAAADGRVAPHERLCAAACSAARRSSASPYPSTLLFSALLYSTRPQSKVLSRTRNPHAVCERYLVLIEPAGFEIW
jgi:hypothetical protein